jgi:hypothetical protein
MQRESAAQREGSADEARDPGAAGSEVALRPPPHDVADQGVVDGEGRIDRREGRVAVLHGSLGTSFGSTVFRRGAAGWSG